MRDDHQLPVTELLDQYNQGYHQAYDQLFSLVYNQLKKVAHNIKFGRSEFETLNTTALVHEAYIKLFNHRNLKWDSRRHFYSLAAKAIRHILVDYARKKLALKRRHNEVELQEDPGIHLSYETAEEIESLEKALKKLEKYNKTVLKVVECRFFAGMSIQETATTLNVSPSTVKRNWAMGRLWLHREIKKLQSPPLHKIME
ncbi:MAG: sigma-70 family RNA polymerase sigma factor [Bacteroidales bacterium]|nr:sigma-70 family RNA polymerase sigma factor [Bacteroidales bacterium]